MSFPFQMKAAAWAFAAALLLFVAILPKVDGILEAVRQLGLYWLVLNEPPPGVGRA